MRILFIANDFPNPFEPGKGLFNMYLARALASRHDIRVICPIPWTAELSARIHGRKPLDFVRHQESDGIRIDYPRYYYPPKCLRNHYGTFMWWSVQGCVGRILGTFQPDAVLGYWAHPDGEVAVRAAQLAAVPSGVIIGGSDVLLITRDADRRRRVTAVLQATDAVIAVHQHLKDKAISFGINPEKVHVWNQGVDSRFSPGDRAQARMRLGIAPDGPAAVWVGRMVSVKGLEILLQAAMVLQSQGNEMKLYLVGDGPLRKSLEEMSASAGLADRVHFVGTQVHERLPDWYRAANLTVLSSWSEGLPNVLRESLACGTPFVATRVGGIADFAAEHRDWLVEPGNPQALAEAIARSLATDAAPLSSPTVSWSDSADAIAQILGRLVRPATRQSAVCVPTCG